MERFQPVLGGPGIARFAAYELPPSKITPLRPTCRPRRSPALRPILLCRRRRNAKKIVNTNRLPAGGAHRISIIAPSDSRLGMPTTSLVQAIGFESTVLFDDSQLLELPPTAIDFPAEDSDVVVLARSHYNDTTASALAHAKQRNTEKHPQKTTAPGRRSKRYRVCIRNWSNKKRRSSARKRPPSQRKRLPSRWTTCQEVPVEVVRPAGS